MAKNFLQRGDVLTVPAPTNVLSGAGVIIGSIFGVAAGGALSGEPLDLNVVGVYELPKVSALAIATGDKVYFDAATSLVNKTASGNVYIGVAVATAPNPSASVNVRLNGSFA